MSAREMSLALGQNPSYINRIENCVAYPSMEMFFSICEYLDITPAEFFDGHNHVPNQRRELYLALDRLNAKQTSLLLSLVHALLGDK